MAYESIAPSASWAIDSGAIRTRGIIVKGPIQNWGWGAGIASTYCLQKCNIRPISKRQFVSKLVERAVTN